MRIVGLAVVIWIVTTLGGGDGASLATFAGSWQGHAHTLNIPKTGYATETVYIGCCDFIIRLEFRLSKPQGTARLASAQASVTRVKLGDSKSWFTKKFPAPRVGDARTITLRSGVILEPFTDAYYCGTNWRPQCGA